MDARSSICGCDAAEYFALGDSGLLAPDDRTELLAGLVVSMSPQQPAHAATVWWIGGRLAAMVGERGIVRSQLPFLAAPDSVPEPDIAVVPYRHDGYQQSHPDHALLIVEVADSSIGQDRFTKSSIYALAGVPDYWLVNLRERRVEWFCSPDRASGVYGDRGIVEGDERLPSTSLELVVRASELFPPR